ncbi:MAG: hypothetical protein JNN27_15365 [Planctomycetes bacterium]|nr:hypothetical protein [Planctomycetota bacterium]
MSHKQHKQKEREKRLRKERNLRRNEPTRAAQASAEGPRDPSLHRMDPERALRAALRAGALEGARDVGELQQRLAAFRGRSAAEFAREALALGGAEAAQELAYQALDASSMPRALALAAKALELDPQCCDALTQLALGRDTDGAQRTAALEHAVRCGAERLGEERLRGDERERIGALVEARPYLRARAQLYRSLLRTDRRDLALEHGRELLELDRGDRHGLRGSVLGLLLERGLVDEARALREQFADDGAPSFEWGEVLEEFLRGGPRAAADALARARRVLPEFESVLFDDDALPSDPDVQEAFHDLGRAWITHGRAFDWLHKGGVLSTSAEREALCASFAPPVATLLTLGEPVSGGPWPDYVAEHGFQSEHVPELVRALGAREFDELDPSDVRFWTPIHAARVLGQLRAAAAIAPLIEFARTHPEDDHLMLPIVMESIGPAAIDALLATLRRPALHEWEHMTPIVALDRIARAHPAEYGRITSALAALLLDYEQRSSQLNALVCDALFALDADTYRPLVANVVHQGAYDAELVEDGAALVRWATSDSQT